MKKAVIDSVLTKWKTKTFIFIALVTVAAIIWMYRRQPQFSSRTFSQISALIEERRSLLPPPPIDKIVHLDLKGAPLKLSFYERFFKMLTELGATGVLIEYEDMFPYTGSLANISATNAYSLRDIKIINALGKKFRLKIIPLVQTFGHLEFLLKLEKWKHLREVRRYPQVICPSHTDSLSILSEMVSQILKAHSDAEMLHIGADEVYLIGECDKCFLRMNSMGWNKQKLFLNHVSNVVKMIKSKHPTLRLLMWDDEFRSLSTKDLMNWNCPVEPVVWKYSRNVVLDLGYDLWNMYSQVFRRIWIASAYKGATGSQKYTVDVQHHIDNHNSWMRIYEKYRHKIKFEGIILTGWQRYDHFAVLCELLPVSIPSLAASLFSINNVPEVWPAVATHLQCKHKHLLANCNFPGSNVLNAALRLEMLQKNFDTLLQDSKVRGWLTDYNVDHHFSNVMLIESAVEDLDKYKMELAQIEANMVMSMAIMYDNYTIDEWCETYIKPLNKHIDDLWLAKEKLLSRDHWPRRPLNSKEL